MNVIDRGTYSPHTELHPRVQALIVIARKEGEPEIKDINGEEMLAEYLAKKYR